MTRRIVLLDPPFAYGRQMVVELEDGTRERVAYDADEIAAQNERGRFPQSIRRDSEMLVERIGERRIRIADLRDAVRAPSDLSFAMQRRLVAVYDAMLREAA